VIVLVRDAAALRATALGLLIAGAAAGAVAPALTRALGPAWPGASLAAALVVGAWLARGARAPVGVPLVVALVAGTLTGLAGAALPAGLAAAALGLGVGLQCADGPERAAAPSRRLEGALRGAAGALAGGVLGGSLALAPGFAGLAAGGQAAALGAAIALGVALAEASRVVCLARPSAPSEVEVALAEAGPQVGPVLKAACAAHGRAVQAVLDAVRRGDDALPFHPRQPLDLARELILAAARSAAEAERARRALVGLDEDAGALEALPELAEARRELRATLTQALAHEVGETARHAAALERLAAATRAGRLAPASEPPQEARAQAEAFADLLREAA